MLDALKYRIGVIAILLLTSALPLRAGEKIKFYSPKDAKDLPRDFQNPNQKSFDPSLAPSLFRSDGPELLPVPPQSAPTGVPKAKNKAAEEEKQKSRDWIFATQDDKKSDKENAPEPPSPEKILGIKDYLLTKPSNPDGMRDFVRSGKADPKLENNNRQDVEEKQELDKKRKGDFTRGQADSIKNFMPESLSTRTTSLNSQGQGLSPSISSFSPVLTEDDVAKEEKLQMLQFKKMLRPRSAGGSSALFDNMNPEMIRNRNPVTARPSLFDELGGLFRESLFAPKQPVATLAPTGLPSLDNPNELPSLSESSGAAAPSQPTRAPAKPGVLPFPKRPGSPF